MAVIVPKNIAWYMANLFLFEILSCFVVNLLEIKGSK